MRGLVNITKKEKAFIELISGFRIKITKLSFA